MRISQRGRPISEMEVEELEATLGDPLPLAYRKFLLRYNGGKPSPSAFNFGDPDTPYSGSVVERFLSLDDGPNSFWAFYEKYVHPHRRIPERLIPIAFDEGDNLVCLGITGEETGKVYFWDHEDELLENKPILVADSFDAFTKSLFKYEIDPLQREISITMSQGDIPGLQRIIEGGLDVNAKLPNGMSLLESAVQCRQSGIIRWLLSTYPVDREAAIRFARRMGEVGAERNQELELLLNGE